MIDVCLLAQHIGLANTLANSCVAADNYGDTSEQSEVDNEKDGAEDDATNEVEDDSMDIDAEEARAGIEGLQINDMSNAEAELDAILARPSKRE